MTKYIKEKVPEGLTFNQYKLEQNLMKKENIVKENLKFSQFWLNRRYYINQLKEKHKKLKEHLSDIQLKGTGKWFCNFRMGKDHSSKRDTSRILRKP